MKIFKKASKFLVPIASVYLFAFAIDGMFHAPTIWYYGATYLLLILAAIIGMVGGFMWAIDVD
jgi:hypothetical protein